MNFIRRNISCKTIFAAILLFAIYGCQTTSNTITPEPSVSTLKSEPEQADKIDEESLAAAKKNMVGRWSDLMGHGGVLSSPSEREAATTGKSVDKITGRSDEIEKRPFVELEKKLYGKWKNIKETESFEFLNDGTVIIIVTSTRGMRQKLKGNYKLVEEGRIKIDFKGDFFAGRMPPSYFKISISENEIILTDEPKGPDEPDGAATIYKRIQ